MITTEPQPAADPLIVRILTSKTFANDDNSCKLLDYLAKQEKPASEKQIAMDVFGRGENFLPQDDATVRNRKSTLVQKLDRYFLDEGRTEPIIVEVITGHGYGLSFKKRQPNVEEIQEQADQRISEITLDFERKLGEARDHTTDLENQMAALKKQVMRPRMYLVFLAIGAILGGFGIWALRRADAMVKLPSREIDRATDPMVELRRREIEREVALIKTQAPATAKPKPIRNQQLVDRVQTGDNPNFVIISDHLVVDLRGWKSVPRGLAGEPHSIVTLLRKLELKKIAKADVFEVESHTTGIDILMSCPEPYVCHYKKQKTREAIGQDLDLVKQMKVDVSKIDVGRDFSLNLFYTYVNNLQVDLNWGVIGYRNSGYPSMLLIFPDEKPFKDYSLKVTRAERDNPIEFSGKRSVMTGLKHDWLYWEVPEPSPPYIYRVYWNW